MYQRYQACEKINALEIKHNIENKQEQAFLSRGVKQRIERVSIANEYRNIKRI